MTGPKPGDAVLASLLGLSIFVGALRLLASPDRQLEVVLRGSPAAVRIERDVGRGLFPADAVTVASSPTVVGKIPFYATAIRVSLVEPVAGARVESMRVDGRSFAPGGALPAPARPSGLMVGVAALVGLVAAAVGRKRLAGHARRHWSTPEAIFRPLGAGTLVVAFVAVFAALKTAVELAFVWVGHFDKPPSWPISIVDQVPPSLAAIAVAVGLMAVLTRSLRSAHRLVPVGLFVAAALVTNTFHGFYGLTTASAGPHSYWHDAVGLSDPLDFMEHFVERQPTLSVHSRTHPPAAVLAYWPGARLGQPAVVSLVLAALAFLITLCSLSSLARRQRSDALLIFSAAPAVQIYFLASLDALICAAFTAALACAFHERPALRRLLPVALLSAAMLTFASLWLFALLGWTALVERERRWPISASLGVTAVGLFTLRWATGFDWFESLRVASALENPHGFRLLVEPVTYLFTRLESVAEPALFAGPFLAGLMLVRPPEVAVVRRGFMVFIAMLATGAFKTGETARAALFLLPLVVLEVTPRLTTAQARQLAFALMAQTTVMQLFGDFFW